ncbi:MAG: hypothetical protein RLZZ436_1433 [Planctomycetota bacterium]
MSAYGRCIVERRESIPVQTIGDYYVHSRNRFNRWMRLLADHSASLICNPTSSQTDPRSGCRTTHAISDLAQHIFINELVSRVWMLLLIAGDRFQRRQESEALARNLLGGYKTLRHRTVELVIHNETLPAPQRFLVQDLRKHTENWSDLLCCETMARFDLWALAYNPEEAQRNFQQRLAGSLPVPTAVAWQFLLDDIRTTFSTDSLTRLTVAPDDRRIIRLMLSSFPRTAGRTALLSGASV